MPVDVSIPELGESVQEAQIARWRKKEGDRVERDEIVVELETDKAAMELPAPAGGRLASILKQEGDTVGIGDVIARIDDGDGQAVSTGEPGERKKPSRPAKQEKKRQPADTPQDRQPENDEGPPPAPPVDVRPRLMPSARHALEEHRLSPEEVAGTGLGGRILPEDVGRRAADESATSDRATASSQGGDEEVVPMSMLRRRIAERLVQSQHDTTSCCTFNEVDLSEVMAFRRRHGEAFESQNGVRLGILSFFVRAAIHALRAIPQANAEIRGTDLILKKHYDIGVAVATDHGLVVPVIRGADRMSLAQIEQCIAELAARARDKTITVEELTGGTFTITNGGVFGSMLSTPIINPPQSAILGLHAIQDRPVARQGQVVIRPMMYLALTYDHRIIDGREAVTFLKHLKECVESPVRMLLDA